MLKKILFFLCVVTFQFYASYSMQKSKKIVGLMQIRNEATIIEQAVHALSLYTDAIVILDDASTDDSVAICESIVVPYHIESIVRNKISAWEYGKESDNRQKLLDAGRSIGGTHFIVLDADEVLTANCLPNNFLRTFIGKLNPGDRLFMPIMHCWGTSERYRTYFNEKMKCFIFCDDGICSYLGLLLHVPRAPLNLAGGVNLEFASDRYGLLHFGYLNWPNVLMRQAWYKCLERVRNPTKPSAEINSWYCAYKEKDAATLPVPVEWLSEYIFFNSSLYDQAEQWRKSQIKGWIAHYGISYFQGLDLENMYFYTS